MSLNLGFFLANLGVDVHEREVSLKHRDGLLIAKHGSDLLEWLVQRVFEEEQRHETGQKWDDDEEQVVPPSDCGKGPRSRFQPRQIGQGQC